MNLLEVRNLTSSFGSGAHGLKNIAFTIDEGEFVVLTGPNGSGKTMLMKHLNGLLTPDEGEILYRSMDIRRNLAGCRQKIGLVFQDADSQIIGQTVEEDILFGPENLGLPVSETQSRLEHALDATGLRGLRHARARFLSGGEKRLLAIAGILAMEPDLVVLDEPFANLDFPAVRRILKLILDLHGRGRTILLITHELEKILAHATRLIVLQSGRIAEDGVPENIFRSLSGYDLVSSHILERPLRELTWLR